MFDSAVSGLIMHLERILIGWSAGCEQIAKYVVDWLKLPTRGWFLFDGQTLHFDHKQDSLQNSFDALWMSKLLVACMKKQWSCC